MKKKHKIIDLKVKYRKEKKKGKGRK